MTQEMLHFLFMAIVCLAIGGLAYTYLQGTFPFKRKPINHINGFILPMPDDPRWMLKTCGTAELSLSLQLSDNIEISIVNLGKDPNNLPYLYCKMIFINTTAVNNYSREEGRYYNAIVKALKRKTPKIPPRLDKLRDEVNALTSQS